VPLLPGFPDAEFEICQVLPNAVEGLTADTVTPSVWPTANGWCFARVTRTGGGDDRITDTSRVTIDVFAATRANASAYAEAVRQYLTQEGCVGVFDTITCDIAPRDIRWNDANTPRRFVADYTATARRSDESSSSS
jgi:hypothetical protein